jgi:hypothetical protein
METVTRFAIQAYDPLEPHFWFLLSSTHETIKDAEDKIRSFERWEEANPIPNLRKMDHRILPFTIEVPV